MICVYLVLILSTCRTRVVLQGIIHVCSFFFNDNVYRIILHVFSSWVCDLLDIMKINLSKLVKQMNTSYNWVVSWLFTNGHVVHLSCLPTIYKWTRRTFELFPDYLQMNTSDIWVLMTKVRRAYGHKYKHNERPLVTNIIMYHFLFS